MKAASLKDIKSELQHLSFEDLLKLNLRLARFKKENKELLTYLLFEAHDEAQFVENTIEWMEERFEEINTASPFYVKKSLRSILRSLRKFGRYSNKKETEIELLIAFCNRAKEMTPSIFENTTLTGIFTRTIAQVRKKIAALHEDLQFDYLYELDQLENKL